MVRKAMRNRKGSGSDDAPTTIAATASLGAAVYESMKHDIVTLALRPGLKISEKGVADRYRTGKAPVRVALTRLVQDGLVENRARSGHIIAPVTIEDMHNIYEMRRLLLPPAARAAAGNVTEALKQAAREVLSFKLDQGDRENLLSFCVANRRFIVELGNASANELLASTIARIEDRALRFLFMMSANEPRWGKFIEQYEEIWSALTAGDGQGAEDAVRRALADSESVALAAVMRMPELRSVNLAEVGSAPASPSN